MNAPAGDGVLLPEEIGGPGPDQSAGGVKTKVKTRSAEERCVDTWLSSGTSGEWTRAHRTPRRAMFTPHRVAGGHGSEVMLNRMRITNGTYVGTGEKFQVIDDYHVASSAHRSLGHGWVGTTHFRELNQQIKVEIEQRSELESSEGLAGRRKIRAAGLAGRHKIRAATSLPSTSFTDGAGPCNQLG